MLFLFSLRPRIPLGHNVNITRLQVRHESVEKLQALRDMAVCLERPLKKPVDLAVFKAQSKASIGQSFTRQFFYSSLINSHAH